MFEDDLSDVESHQKWYKEYHPGGILGITWKSLPKKTLSVPPCTRSTGFYVLGLLSRERGVETTKPVLY